MKSALELMARAVADLGIQLTSAQLAAFGCLETALLQWNRRSNLTAITDPTGIAIKHFYDSLTVAPLLRGNESVLDIGSGAGFPALPLKIAMPELTMVTVDAVEKKILFQRHVIRTLGLTGITALHERVEKLTEHSACSYDVIVSRAFTALADFVRLSTPLLAPAGRIIAMKGKEGRAEADAVNFSNLGMQVVSIEEFSLPDGAGERSLITLKKAI